jgi:3-dehydroquinate dehydratase-1
MVNIGTVALDGTARIVAPFNDTVTAEDISAAKAAGLDLAEVRIDHFRSFDTAHVKRSLDLFAGQIPTIATIRIKAEGGGWDGPEERRQALFRSILGQADAFDIELRSANTLRAIAPLLKDSGKPLIVSFHDFDGTPALPGLRNTVRAAKAAGADIIKIATAVQTPQHVRMLASLLLDSPDLNLVVIGMGERGLATRLLFPALGSVMTFACIGSNVTAPGQLAFDKMFEILRIIDPTYRERKLDVGRSFELA